MTDRKCTVELCASRARRRGLCDLHYQRWRRHGDARVFRPDATRGCAIAGCQGQHYGRGWCRMHWTRWSRTGDPLGVRRHFSPLAGMIRDLNPAWVGDDAGYEAVHKRLRVQRGPAAEYDCAHCAGRAEEWAYDHGDSDERMGVSGLVFSVDLDHYIPLCAGCHRRFDAVVRQRDSTSLDEASSTAHA